MKFLLTGLYPEHREMLTELWLYDSDLLVNKKQCTQLANVRHNRKNLKFL